MMKRHLRHLREVRSQNESVVTIGVYDGVHRGHQVLIERLVQRAHSRGLQAVALSFHPHPDKILKQAPKRYYLTTPDKRADLLQKLGVDLVITHPFDEESRHLSAQQFVEQLVEKLKLKDLWVGSDFALGYQREGTVDYLRNLGQVFGFDLTAVEPIADETCGGVFSSSRIRDLLSLGAIQAANDMLGRAYSLAGTIVHGQHRGRAIGVPTANLEPWDEQVVPANGVYAGWATLAGERFMTATNIGVRPTFGEARLSVEAHLLDFERDIYGEQLELTFAKRLRPERKFDDQDDLVNQIQRDIAATRLLLQDEQAG